MKRVGLLGSEKEDFLLYLGMLLHKLGKTVCIVDNTQVKYMKYSVTLMNNDDIAAQNEITYRGIDFIFGAEFEDERLKEYDVVFIEYGKSFCSDIAKCDLAVVMTDVQAHNIMPLKQFGVGLEPVKSIIVLRDTFSKADTKRIKKHFGFEGDVKAVCEIKYNEKNSKIRLYAQYNNTFKFGGISKDYTELLVNFAEELTTCSNKEIRKVLRKVMG